MKVIRGIKLGGLQQKIFNLVLIFVLAMIGVFVAVSLYQEHNLASVVQEAEAEQRQSITAVSEGTMEQVLESTMVQSTGLQAYIANDLFGDVQCDVMTLQAFAEGLFENAESFSAQDVEPPDRANDGVPSVQLQHEAGVDPADSKYLGLVANMGDIMLAMFENSDKLNSCFVATTDGNIVYVDDRAGSYFAEDGSVYDFDVRNRVWYKRAVEAGKMIFTGIELDAFTGIPGLVCAAPVYQDGELVAVVGADIFLTSISDYVNNKATDGGFICIVNENGQVIFSPYKDGIFCAELSGNAQDLRESENTDLAQFIGQALTMRTELETISADGREYYMAGAPMENVGWAVLSVVDKELTHQPTAAMLRQYESINDHATNQFQTGISRAQRLILIVTAVLLILAAMGALTVAQRIVKPVEHMTRRINTLSGSDNVFEMEDVYRTNDEIEILAEAFETMSKRTRTYITEITKITAEKERIGTELELATRIQADMLPNIFPAFPERPDFDIYGSMTPAKEVGGDFYDFFLVDNDHLGLVMADVSGKGVPAALFMMVSKILVQNYAMTGRSPAEVLRAVNEQICSNNREEMFVTVWFGVLDLQSGTLTAANAGHEYPILKKPNGVFEVIKDKHGFVIGGMPGMKYKEYQIQMDPGAKLFLYTDGVPEATNDQEELFGLARTVETLNQAETGSPQTILNSVAGAVEAFVGSAPQFDDLTMLCVHYIGKIPDSGQSESKTSK